MKFPKRADIVRLNYRHLENTGEEFIEPDNLINEDSLEWVLEAIQHPLFGVDLYPTLTEKAARLAWTIIRCHVFFDGNKRTGMSALEALLRMHGYRLAAGKEEMKDAALRVAGARGLYTFDDFVAWIRDKIELRNGSISSLSSDTK